MTAVRQRLVDVIAERAHSLPETDAIERPSLRPAPVAEEAHLLAGPGIETALNKETAALELGLLARTIEIAPAQPPVVLPALDDVSSVQSASDAGSPAIDAETPIEAEDAAQEIAALPEVTEAPALVIEDVAKELTVSAVTPDSAEEAPEVVAGVSAPTEPEPVRRKRPRRKSRRRAAPRKRRAKKA